MPAFTVYPAIELRGGMALKYENAGMGTRANRADAVSYARDLEAQGAEFIHLFNLDGPFNVGAAEHSGSVLQGAQRNLEALTMISKAVKAPLQFGGGVRDGDAVKMLLKAGAKRVALGEAAMRDPALVKSLCAANADSILVSMSAKDGIAVDQQWVPANAKLRIEELAAILKQAGVKHVMYQDASAEAANQGPPIVHAARAGLAGVDVIIAGGVTTLAHVRQCAATAGIAGLLVGRPIAQGKFTLKQALESAATGLKDRK